MYSHYLTKTKWNYIISVASTNTVINGGGGVILVLHDQPFYWHYPTLWNMDQQMYDASWLHMICKTLFLLLKVYQYILKTFYQYIQYAFSNSIGHQFACPIILGRTLAIYSHDQQFYSSGWIPYNGSLTHSMNTWPWKVKVNVKGQGCTCRSNFSSRARGILIDRWSISAFIIFTWPSNIFRFFMFYCWCVSCLCTIYHVYQHLSSLIYHNHHPHLRVIAKESYAHFFLLYTMRCWIYIYIYICFIIFIFWWYWPSLPNLFGTTVAEDISVILHRAHLKNTGSGLYLHSQWTKILGLNLRSDVHQTPVPGYLAYRSDHI